MSFYLDTSVLAALFVEDPFTARADQFIESNMATVFVSDFAATEFASVIARKVRSREITEPNARIAFRSFDTWTSNATQRVEIDPADIATAEAWLRRLDLTLRAPDAIHIAIARRTQTALVTFDNGLLEAAQKLGTGVATA